MRRVVITGLGIVSALGDDKHSVCETLRLGRSGITASPDYRERGFRSQVYGRPALDPKDHLDKRSLRFMGEGSAWAVVAMNQAIEDSGLEPRHISHERTGLIVGSGGPSTRAIVAAADIAREKSPKRIGPFAVPKAMCSTASAILSTHFKILGVNYSISSACTTSLHCIGAAYEQIQTGRQDIMFAGGCEELDWTLSVLFDAMGAMSSSYNGTPELASRPFSQNRDGFVIAGGAGLLILEDLEHARARGARIYGEITGYAATSDGYDMVAPSGEGAERAMKQVLEQIGGRRVDYINPHATSTPVGDIVEAKALASIFKGSSMPAVSATKSLSGHSLGAAGAQELIYTLLMMENSFIAPTINAEDLDPDMPDLHLITKTENKEITCALSNSFGFGGTNGTLALVKAD